MIRLKSKEPYRTFKRIAREKYLFLLLKGVVEMSKCLVDKNKIGYARNEGAVLVCVDILRDCGYDVKCRYADKWHAGVVIDGEIFDMGRIEGLLNGD